MDGRKPFSNAPLIDSECLIVWESSEQDADVIPTAFKNEFYSQNSEEISDFDFEWMIPKESFNTVTPSDVDVYRIEYSHRNIRFTLTLSKSGATIASDSSYQTWIEFREEVIRLGKTVGILLQPSGRKITSIRLRYIDAFRADLLSGKRPIDFISQDLGISIAFPDRILSNLGNNNATTFFFHYLVPINDTTDLLIALGDANVGDDANAAICDITAISKSESLPTCIVETADELHKIIDKLFLSLIEPIRERLE